MSHGNTVRLPIAFLLVLALLAACSETPEQNSRLDRYIDSGILGEARSEMRELMSVMPAQYLDEPIAYVTADGEVYSNRTDIEKVITYKYDPAKDKYIDENGNTIIPPESSLSDALSTQNLPDSSYTSCNVAEGPYRRMYTKVGGKGGPYGMPGGEYLAYHKVVYGVRGPESIRVRSTETAYAFIGGNGRNSTALDAGLQWNPGDSSGNGRGWALFMYHQNNAYNSLPIRWPGNQNITLELQVLSDRPDHIMIRGVDTRLGQARTLVIDRATGNRFSSNVTDWGPGGYLINFKQTVSIAQSGGYRKTGSYFRGTTITGTRIGPSSSNNHLLRSQDVGGICAWPNTTVINEVGGVININN